MRERTLCIIKPDAVAAHQAGQILARLEVAGFELVEPDHHLGTVEHQPEARRILRIGSRARGEEEHGGEHEEDRRDRRRIHERGHSDIFKRSPVRRARWIAARNAQWASAA